MFVEEPVSQVVTNGTNVTFTCAVISSPLSSTISWRNGSVIMNRFDVRLDISQSLSQVKGGIRISSSLTIINVDGFDSNTVKCVSEYSVDMTTIISTIRSEAILSVLGEVESI